LYVLRGRLRLVLGEHDLVLASGEAAEFDTHVPHWFGNADSKAVEFCSAKRVSGSTRKLVATAERESEDKILRPAWP
jgi:quercetin dioxygenase-like cupin family protein